MKISKRISSVVAPTALGLLSLTAGCGMSSSKSFCEVYLGPDGIDRSGDGGVYDLVDAGLLNPTDFSGPGEAAAYASRRCS